ESNCNVILDYSNAQVISGVGTVTTTGTTTVTGSGSVFLNQFLLGDMILINGQTQPQPVVTLTSATVLVTLNAFPTISTPQTFSIIRNKASLRDSYALNGQNAMLRVKGASALNTLTTVTNFVFGNGLGIVEVSNASQSTPGSGDTVLLTR